MPVPRGDYVLRLETLPEKVTLRWLNKQGALFGEVTHSQLLSAEVWGAAEALLCYRLEGRGRGPSLLRAGG
eukprot:gene5626-8566_t